MDNWLFIVDRLFFIKNKDGFFAFNVLNHAVVRLFTEFPKPYKVIG